MRAQYYLRAVVLLPHGPVDQLERVLVEVVDELLEVGVMCLRRKALSADPLNLISLVNAFVVKHLVLGQHVPCDCMILYLCMFLP